MPGTDESKPETWPLVRYGDIPAGMHFLCDVLGFEAKVTMLDDYHGVVVYEELRWNDDSGVLVVNTHDLMAAVSDHLDTGVSAVHLVSRDVDAIYQRVLASGAEVLRSPEQTVVWSRPDAYAFTVRDPWGNLWTVATHRGTF